MNAGLSSDRPSKEGIALTTLVVVLATETVFFGTLMVAYLYLRNSPSGWAYQATSIYHLLVPSINTGILLVSCYTAWRSLKAIEAGNVNLLRHLLAITLLLGMLFVAGQSFEFTHSGMRPDDLAVGGVFFTLMGFHALHVLAGVVILGLNLLRTDLGDFTKESHVPIKVSTWFWYYVAAVWVALFTALYLI
jgi:cytochrome c oxidase subunit 3